MSCSNCQQLLGTHQCQDCFGPIIWCDACCLKTHSRLPFHRIQTWNGQFFERTDFLRSTLCLDLHHYPDDCPPLSYNTQMSMGVNSEISDDDENATDGYRPTGTQMGSRSVLTIVASTGIFTRMVRWCQCASNLDQYVQLLLRAKLFPASFINPKTAFTFEVLDHFRINALECKTSAMTFMSKLRQLTNEAFPSKVLVSCPTDWISFWFAFRLTMWRRIVILGVA